MSLDDPYVPLVRATNEPPPIRPGGPPIFSGAQKTRGLELAGRYCDGWVLPMGNSGDGPDGLRTMTAEVAEPLRATL